jgi:hypothetical protein
MRFKGGFAVLKVMLLIESKNTSKVSTTYLKKKELEIRRYRPP